jgi:RNA polymerase sigma factor (TIGR02999 family)
VADSELTEVLAAAARGEAGADDRLFQLVYGALKTMARKHLRDERPDHTLGPTALVHEAYLKLVDQLDTSWESRRHFYGAATRAMRQILVDHARRRGAAKRSRHRQITLDPRAPVPAPDPTEEILTVNEALAELAREDPRSARLVELRYFGGMSIEQAAGVLGISTATAKRDWRLARAWLQRTLS